MEQIFNATNKHRVSRKYSKKKRVVNLYFVFVRYVGEMGRETATARLERRVDGTFLLRVRPHHAAHPALHPANDTHYALSLKYVPRATHPARLALHLLSKLCNYKWPDGLIIVLFSSNYC